MQPHRWKTTEIQKKKLKESLFNMKKHGDYKTTGFEYEGPREECGVFGIYNHPEAAQLIYLGLYALQHRGQESCGIVTSDGREMRIYKNMGLVGDVFNPSILKQLQGHIGIGHVRYSTAGSSAVKNAQPLLVDFSRGNLAIAHNGNLTNARSLRYELEQNGSIFQTTSDSEIILHILATQRLLDDRDALIYTLRTIRGAYSVVMTTPEKLIGARDPHGFRPLCLGRVDDSYVLASETCALDLINAKFIREIEPGEVVFIDEDGVESVFPFEGERIRQAFCIFEYIYFARPDSFLFGKTAHVVRKKFGRRLAIEHPVKADVVIAIPDTGNSAAVGYSEQSGIPFDLGITRNHYIGRTFLQPKQAIRDFGVKVKLNPVRDIIKGQRVIVVEDSIVRGTTSVLRMAMLREAGAKEIHLRVSCPPHKHPCYYGIDFPTQKELIAARMDPKKIARHLNIESLGYLSKEGMLKCVNTSPDNFCTACFDGDYPVPMDLAGDKYMTDVDRRQELLEFS